MTVSLPRYLTELRIRVRVMTGISAVSIRKAVYYHYFTRNNLITNGALNGGPLLSTRTGFPTKLHSNAVAYLFNALATRSVITWRRPRPDNQHEIPIAIFCFTYAHYTRHPFHPKQNEQRPRIPHARRPRRPVKIPIEPPARSGTTPLPKDTPRAESNTINPRRIAQSPRNNLTNHSRRVAGSPFIHQCPSPAPP